MESERELGPRRYRVYQIIGIVAGAVFLALGAAAFLAGGGPVVGAIALTGGAVTLAVSIVHLVRS